MKPIETEIIEIIGGYWVPKNDSHLAAWQIECGKLDHDSHLPPFVVSKLKEGDFVLDAGAFNGDHSIAYSKAVGAGGLVLAVEAGAMAFSCLKHNVSLFPHKNTFAVQACLSEVCGSVVDHNPNGNLGASVCKAVTKEDMKAGGKYLQTVTIDYLVGEAKRKCDFLKLDVEGWETRVLIGASRTIKKDRPQMLIEVNDVALRNQQSDADEIFEILGYHGYSWEIVQPQCNLGDPQYDIYCKPKWKIGDLIPEVFQSRAKGNL